MRPLHESGPARTAVSTIVRELGRVKGENRRIARKVYWGDSRGAGEPVHRWRECRGSCYSMGRLQGHPPRRMPLQFFSSLLRGVIRHFVLDDLSALHYEFDALKFGDVGQRIS